ncbi:CHAP domain-containing protein [Staphylococcus nepalensis]|uniref:CHAP domain-containing protein n=1 Tax=Staphylococcus nepalensis TaxID=214473 RepID=UPI000D589957|nr:CHAP domain-containing protein [Staphylococcus nepalensis]AWI43901.1 CHAP domain-containing protein [Staphylococcus nepalensis]
MKKIATATIATAGIATFAFAQNEADAAENNNGYNPNDPTSYSYSYTIDQQGDYHYTWQGNWNPSQADQAHSNYTGNTNSGQNNTYGSTYGTSTQSYTANNNTTGGGGATSDRNIQVTTTSAPSSSSSSISNTSGSSNNLYTAGQCTYYVFDKVGGKIGSTWGNANNWASAAAASGYTVNNSPSQGSILQSSTGAMGHVAYVENVNSDGSIQVSEMNYGQGPGVVTSRTISASQASSYNYIH